MNAVVDGALLVLPWVAGAALVALVVALFWMRRR